MTRYALEPGNRFGELEILAPLGRGAMAEVYLARDRRTNEKVALKVMRRGLAESLGTERRFEREGRAIAKTRHPNVVAIRAVGEQDGSPYIAMEYVEGETLRTMLDRGALPLETVLDIGLQIAEGLASAHEAGIVHRDLKPENVMVTAEGNVKVLDFGLSKSLSRDDASDSDDALTLPGTILGTVQYMSPEQASGRSADFRADQFSLGAILHEMATGAGAFQRDTLPRTLAAVIEGEPPRPPAELGELGPVVERALSKSPEGRFGSMREMACALREARRARAARSGRLQSAIALGLVASLAVAVALLF